MHFWESSLNLSRWNIRCRSSVQTIEKFGVRKVSISWRLILASRKKKKKKNSTYPKELHKLGIIRGHLHKHEAVKRGDSICVYPTRPPSPLADFIRLDLRLPFRLSLSSPIFASFLPSFLSLFSFAHVREEVGRKAASKLVQIHRSLRS